MSEDRTELVSRIVGEALGEASGLFMSLGATLSRDMVMPAREMARIAEQATARIMDVQLGGRVADDQTPLR